MSATKSDQSEIDYARAHGWYLPTPAEITAEAESIRDGWSEDEHKRKAVGEQRGPWEVPVAKSQLY